MNKELLVGVDEFSLVLFSQFPVDSEGWLQSAYIIINEFIGLSKIEVLFGKVTEMYEKKPAAYSQAFTIENVPWYFAIAVHEYFPHMGILIKFSAEAWANYQKAYFEQYNQTMNIAVFFKIIESSIYQYRLSRIDFTADYKNYVTVSPHYIYNKLLDKNYHIEDHNGRTAQKKLSALQNDFETNTFYVGSRKENSKLLLRVYDKKREQTSQNGFRLDEALNCNSWTRFEASFKGDYAHQITEQLVNGVSSEIELSQFIASKICDKYRFVDNSTGEYTSFTKDLLFIVDNSTYSALRSESPKNNSLSKSIAHIIKGSGLYPLLYKIGQIWNKQTETEFLEFIYQIYETYYKQEMQRSLQLNSWIKKNYSSLSKKKLSDCFIGESLSKYDISKLSKQPQQIFNLKKLDTETFNYDKEISDEEFNKLLYEEF